MAFDGLDGMTVRSLWEEQACVHADDEFLVFRTREGGESRYTYAEFDRQINRTANLFLDLGVRKGDTVAVHLCNCVEFMLCLFGLAKIGGIMVPVNEQNLEEESAYVLECCQAKVLLTAEKQLAMYRGLVTAGRGAVEQVLVAQPSGASADALDFNEAIAQRSDVLQKRVELSCDDTVEIMFTSGTTSDPKGVEFTHANFIYAGIYTQWQTLMRADDRMITTMPACHSNFQLAAMMPVIVAGATLIMVEKYSASRFFAQVREYHATIAQAVSMMVRTLLMQPENPLDGENELRDVLYFLPLDTGDKERFEERFNVRLMNSYGSTESLTWVITDYPAGKRKWPSVGRVGIGYRAKIVDDEGRELPIGEIGEIMVWGVPGRTLMKGYYHDAENTARTLEPDGWMHTGDKGYVDDEGFFYFVDRKSNMIKRSGENISSTEIEEVLLQHPKIGEAAVIGVPDPVRDQAVKAFIVPFHGVQIDEAEVRVYCERHLAAFKIPSFIEICDALPRTCSMKVEKKKLH